MDRDARPRDAGEVARAVSAHLAAAVERARQVELDRVRAEEQRKRLRVRAALAVAMLGLLASAGFGVLLADLWQRAERGKETADYHRDQAEEEKTTADYHRSQAVDEKKIADGLRAEADAQRLKARQYLYYSRVGLASRAWNDVQVHRMGVLLEQERTQVRGEDLRGFEWHYLWRIRSADQHVLRGHTDAVRAVAWRPDGKRLASGSFDKTVRVWNANTDQDSLQLGGHRGWVWEVAFSPDGRSIASTGQDLTAKVWDAVTGREQFPSSSPHKLRTLRRVKPRWQVSGHGRRRPHHQGLDATTGKELRSLRVAQGKVWKVAFTPDGNHLVSATGTFWYFPPANRLVAPEVKVWRVSDWQEVATLKGHTGLVTSLSFSSEGAVIFPVAPVAAGRLAA